MGEINDIGGICLSLFLGMAMITLKLWQLAELALPLIVLLAGQTLFMILYVVLVVFNVMGRDYDAAVISSGICGFGMGATPNAMANMQAICEKYSPSVKAYLLIPLVGSLFADFINSLVHYGVHQFYLNHAVQSSARHEKASRDDLEETSVCFGNGVRKRNRFIMLAMKMLPYRKYIPAR